MFSDWLFLFGFLYTVVKNGRFVHIHPILTVRSHEKRCVIRHIASLPPSPFYRYTMRMSSSDLAYIQRILVTCVRDNPGRLNRSELAKLLVGSRALEMKKWAGNKWNGRLRGMIRKSVTVDVDILLQQGYLALDSREMVVLGQKAKEAVTGNLK